MRNVRVIFKKQGRAVYISHLDVNRFMIRAVRLAKLPIWYTEGFNPHPYITFAQPLSLGFASECELLDMKLTDDDMPLSDVKARLSAVMPQGLVITDVIERSRDPKEIAFAVYDILYKAENHSPSETADILNKLFSLSSLTVMKKTKKGEKEFDLSPHINDILITECADKIKISVTLPSSNDLSVNPTLLIKAAEENTDLLTDDLFITKKALLDKNKNDFLD